MLVFDMDSPLANDDRANAVNAPLITVITPAYNVAKYIGEAIESVLGQSEDRFEYLVVDDGSTDETAQIAASYAQQDTRLRLINGSHAGSSAARNVALREAKGRYVAFLDADDRWHPTFLERMLEVITSAPRRIGVVFCQAWVIDESGRKYWRRARPARDYGLDDLLIFDNPTANGSVLFIKRSCFDQAGLFNEAMQSSVDLDMWLRIAHNTDTPVFRGVKDLLVDLRVRSGAISRDLETRMKWNDHILDEWVPRLREKNRPLAYVRPAVMAFRAGSDERAERLARKALAAGAPLLAGDAYGRRVLVWDKLRPSQRTLVRKSASTGKQAIIRTITRSASLAGKAISKVRS